MPAPNPNTVSQLVSGSSLTVALLAYKTNPSKTLSVASRSARPTMFVTDSVTTGWVAKIAAAKKAGQSFSISTKTARYTKTALAQWIIKFSTWYPVAVSRLLNTV